MPYDVAIEDYMKTEVIPHVPDAKAFFEEDLSKKKPVIKTGAEIPFVNIFINMKHLNPLMNLPRCLVI